MANALQSFIGDNPSPVVVITKEQTPIGMLTKVTIPHQLKSVKEVIDFAVKHGLPAERGARGVTLHIWS